MTVGRSQSAHNSRHILDEGPHTKHQKTNTVNQVIQRTNPEEYNNVINQFSCKFRKFPVQVNNFVRKLSVLLR